MMKTSLKKGMCLALALLAVSATLTAAPKKKSSKKADPYKNVKKEVNPATKKVWDLGGISVILADWWSGDDWEKTPAGGPVEEANRAWHHWTQDTYNYKMIQKQLTGAWDSHPQAVANYCITGGKENYVFTIDGRSVVTGMRANLFYDLSKLKCIDWTNAKWASGVENMFKKGDSFYFMRPLTPEPRHGVYFNKRLLEEAGIKPDTPYDLQKAGNWNWTTFEELLKKCTYDRDNDGLNDSWGMANSSTEFVPTACVSNGMAMIGYENGKFVNNCGKDQVLEAITWCADMAAKYAKPQPEGSEWNWMYPAFINGEVAFLTDEEYHAQPNGQFSKMSDDWGFVCFPVGPRGDGKFRTMHKDNFYVIPACYDAERAEKVAKAFDFWSDLTPGYDTPDSWKEQYYSCFRDVRAVDETLELMKATPNPRYDIYVPGINYMGDMIWAPYAGAVTAQQAYEDCKNAWQGLLDDVNR